MPSAPFKLNQDRRHHIPKQKHKVTNWREYDASLRQRGSLTVWFTDEAVQAWQAEPRTTRGGQPNYVFIRRGPPTRPPRDLSSILQAFVGAPVRTGSGVADGDHHRSRA